MLTNIRHFKLIAILLSILVKPLQAQITDNFSDGNHNQNPSWQGDTGSFQVNPKFELSSNSVSGTSGQISLYLPQIFQGLPYEWGTDFSFSLNPSSQNLLRFYLFADSFPLQISKHALFLNFGGSTGSTDSLSLYEVTNGTPKLLGSGRPGTLGKSSNKGKVYGLLNQDSVLKIWLDTSNGFYVEPEITTKLKTLALTGLFGLYVKHSSSTGKSYTIDNIFSRIWQPDTLKPFIRHLSFKSPNKLNLSFSEPLDSGALSFWIAQNHLKANTILSGTDIEFEFLTNPIETSWYCLNFKGIQDLAGNPIQPEVSCFNTRNIYSGQLRITELMPDPDPSKGLPLCEFIELRNMSSDTIQLEGISISDPSSLAVLRSLKLAPDSFVLLVAEKDSIHYPKAMAIQGFPSLNNSGDQVQVKNQQGTIVDEINYTIDWYGINPVPDGGISLSLIYPNKTCLGSKSWMASAEVNGGSPGKSNQNWNPEPEIEKPSLLSCIWRENLELEIEFSKAVNSGLLELKVDGNKTQIPLNTSSRQTKFRIPVPAMLSGTMFELVLSNWQDCAGLKLDTSLTLTYYSIRKPKSNELLITEILCEPISPDAPEFIELFNRTTEALALSNVQLLKPGYTIKLPEFVLNPNSYLVLSKSSFNAGINHLILPYLFSLNQEDSLQLKDDSGSIIHEVFYTNEFYGNEFKRKQKGWSLELQSKDYVCSGKPVWGVCENSNKHTAGSSNSTVKVFTDYEGPELVSIYPLDSSQIRFKFNEPVNLKSGLIAINGQEFQLRNFGHQRTELIGHLHPEQFLQNEKSWNVFRVEDCYGNLSKEFKGIISLPEPISKKSKLVFNEILFDPKPGKEDFIEILNCGNTWIDLKNFGLLRVSENAEEAEIICQEGEIIAPGEYKILSLKSQKEQFAGIPDLAEIIQKLPSMPDEGVQLKLLYPDGQIADSCAIESSMHFALLSEKEGVSLERLDPFKSGSDPWNWHSASFLSGYGTPGRENSMKVSRQNKQNQYLTIEPEIISPDLDGFNDFCTLNFNLPEPAMALTLHIVNWEGKEIKTLTLANQVPTQGQLIWDGLSGENNLVPEGIYLILLECFSEEGRLYTDKKWVVIARRDRL